MNSHLQDFTPLLSLSQLSPEQPVLFITGSTGGLGAGLLPRLLVQQPNAQFVMLIRGADQRESESKLDALLDFCGIASTERARMVVLRGDVSADLFGLSPADHALLAALVSDVFHLAADLRFDLPIEQSRMLNVDSTRRAIALVREAGQSGRLRRFNYVSTAYISGSQRNAFHESDINIGQEFFNAYEQSKMEAEQLVDAFKAEAPVTIYRPSMIIGEAATGKIRNFFGIYEFLKLANMGKISVVPAEPSARPDLVPLDYVADGLAFLAQYPAAVGQTYHLAAGIARSMAIRDIVDIVGKTGHFDHLKKLPEIVAPDAFSSVVVGLRMRAFKNSALSILLKSYMHYLTFERNFVVDDTARLLEENGIVMQPIGPLLPAMCRYALEHNFGMKVHPKAA
ncbi:MAG: SDR family oxidoreductase [Pseudomonadota bacterium]